jgi:hypothetical protein
MARKRVSLPPSVAPGALRRVPGFRGFFRQDFGHAAEDRPARSARAFAAARASGAQTQPLTHVLSKNARRPAARPLGLIRETRRDQGPR